MVWASLSLSPSTYYFINCFIHPPPPGEPYLQRMAKTSIHDDAPIEEDATVSTIVKRRQAQAAVQKKGWGQEYQSSDFCFNGISVRIHDE